MRPPPQVNHRHVVFLSLKDVDPLPTTSDVVIAAYHQFSHRVVAVDVFPASCQVALAFTTSAHADEAAKAGLQYGEDAILPLTRRPQYRPRLEKVTVSGVDCTVPSAASEALREFFGHYGRVVEIAPRYWEDVPVHTGTWHVTIDINAAVKGKLPGVPPDTATIGGVEVIINIPQLRRACPVCKVSDAHPNPACRFGQQLARKEKQRQQQEQKQQQQQQQEQKQQRQQGPQRWADLLRPRPKQTVPPPPQPAKPAKGKGKDTATKVVDPKPTTTTNKQDPPTKDPKAPKDPKDPKGPADPKAAEGSQTGKDPKVSQDQQEGQRTGATSPVDMEVIANTGGTTQTTAEERGDDTWSEDGYKTPPPRTTDGPTSGDYTPSSDGVEILHGSGTPRKANPFQ
jgi:hypothetical protein